MNKKLIAGISVIAGVTLLALAGAAMATKSDTLNPDLDLAYCDRQIGRSVDQLRDASGKIDYSMMPRNIAADSTRWHLRPVCPEEWCSGFWPGILWYDYENTKDEKTLKLARDYSREMHKILERPVFDHDLGFLLFCSLGNGFRLTGDPGYKRDILNAADSLATLYNPKVGTILAWPRNVEMFGGHHTIMDTMINLEMLFWAAKNGGNPYLYDIAVKHAETTMRNQFRDDYTCYHVAVYNSETGEFRRGCTHQGYSDESTWARGEGWAIYGYTVVYRETGEKRFLDFVTKVADTYLSRLPGDYVPYWDFDDPRIPDCPRDASAACVVASGLLELSRYVDDETSERYMDAATKMLASLGSDRYRSNERNPSFLLHSTGHHPAGSEVDASIIYADYYYIEALTRLKHIMAGEPICQTPQPLTARK